MYLAMWSGPRNISTALMRAWGSRPDTFVTDEPLYAHYLRETGFEHPGRDEVIASQENDWRRVLDWLTGPIPEGKTIWYQKHMAQHLLPHIDRSQFQGMKHCLLIRDPAAVITSFSKVVANPRPEDLGLPQQTDLYRWIESLTGSVPIIIDSRDVLANPSGMLRALCGALGVEYTDAMLSWEPGFHATDGVWAKYWYREIETATGFRPYEPKPVVIPDELKPVLDACNTHYLPLYEKRLLPAEME